MTELTAERLRELLHYDPETGIFTWRKKSSPCSNVRVGDVAGSVDRNGYRRTAIDGRRYQESRLAWLHVTGAWPEREIDHKNLNRSDNRFANLREATRSENSVNKRGTSASGLKGVYWGKRQRKWHASIRIRGKYVHLGFFVNRDEAALTYATVACGVSGEFSRPAWRDVLAEMRGVISA